jgi:DNA primase
MIADFLELLVPVDGTPAKKWLMDRRIFKPTWDSARLRFVGDYPAVHQKLLELYPMEDLQGAGLFNQNGKLVFYKHPLVIPYLDHEGRAQYFQARAIEKEVRPKELNLRGQVPFPYNEPALDGKDGFIYLCEGAIDTLTVLNRTSYSAVGIPGAGNFRPEWAKLFANKKVTLCLDGDEAGRKAAGRIQALLAEAGVASNIKALPDGEDINSWFGGH